MSVAEGGVRRDGRRNRRVRLHTRCARCQGRPEVQLRQHNASFCRDCFQFVFKRQVERTIGSESMLSPDEPVLVAVSGGKDSLVLWDVLVDLGYRTTGLHLSLGMGEYSEVSTQKTVRFAEVRELPLIVVSLAEQGPGMAIPTVAAFTNRAPCSACGAVKRHFFDQVAVDRGFPVVATGHNLDDEAARLLGNLLHWQMDHLAKQDPVLRPAIEGFVRKVKPLYFCSEYETAVYAFFRAIDYVVDECPNSVGATQLLYKDVLNRLEDGSPGTKLGFVRDFLRRGRAAFAREEVESGQRCEVCGLPSYGAICRFCRLMSEVASKRARATTADAEASG